MQQLQMEWADVTNEQWDSFVKMIYLIVRDSAGKADACDKLKYLMRDQSGAREFIEKYGVEDN